MPNHIDDRPDRAVARLLRDLFLYFKEMFFEYDEQQDSVAVWLVGMSTASIALIISQYGKFSSALYPTLKWSVGFLTGTIMLGLLFRIFHLLLQERKRYNLGYTVSWLSVRSEDSTEPPINLPEDVSARYIAVCLYNHMGIYIEPDLLREIEIKNDVDYWRDRYEEYSALYYRSEELKHQSRMLMLEEFYAVMADLEGIPLEKYKETLEKGKSAGVQKRRIKKICTLSYIFMCISFTISITIISWGFITTDLKANQPTKTTNQQTIAPAKQVPPTQTDKSD